MATDGLMPGTASPKTLLSVVFLPKLCSFAVFCGWCVIKCSWLPVAILLFCAYWAFLVVFYDRLWLFVFCWLHVVPMFFHKPLLPVTINYSNNCLHPGVDLCLFVVIDLKGSFSFYHKDSD